MSWGRGILALLGSFFFPGNFLAAIPRSHHDRHGKAKYKRAFASRHLVREGLVPTHTCVGAFFLSSCCPGTQGETGTGKFCISIQPFSFFFLSLFMTYSSTCHEVFMLPPFHWQPSSVVEYINPRWLPLSHACCVGQPFAPFSP